MKFDDLKIGDYIVLIENIYKKRFLVTWINFQDKYVALSYIFKGKNMRPCRVLEADFNKEKWEFLR
ncbi:MAG: hypothetical protein WC144_08300 [Sulfurimonas sp.]|jgi:hypothetical protein